MRSKKLASEAVIPSIRFSIRRAMRFFQCSFSVTVSPDISVLLGVEFIDQQLLRVRIAELQSVVETVAPTFGDSTRITSSAGGIVEVGLSS